MKVTQRNAISARWLITEAFITLLAVYPFEKITVHAIVHKAGISRSTFYMHFQDKIDLLDQMTEQILGELVELYSTEWDDERFSGMQVNADQQLLSGAVAICEHVRTYKNFYFNRYKDLMFVTQLSELLRSCLLLIYQDETHATFAAYGTVGYIGRWLSEGLKGTPVEVAPRLISVALLSLPQVRKKAQEERALVCHQD